MAALLGAGKGLGKRRPRGQAVYRTTGLGGYGKRDPPADGAGALEGSHKQGYRLPLETISMALSLSFSTLKRALFLNILPMALLCACAKEDSAPAGASGSLGNPDAQADGGGQAGSGDDAGEAGGSAGEGGSAGVGGEGGSAGDAGTGGSAGQEPSCEKHWTREVCPSVGGNASVNVEVTGGAMRIEELNAPYICGTITPPQLPIKVYQDGLVGDFSVSFSFEGFSAGAKEASLRAYVLDLADNKKIAELSIIKSDTGYDILASLTTGTTPQEQKKHVSSDKGVFRFVRLGSALTVDVETLGGTASVGGLFSKGELRVGLGLRAPFNAPIPPVASKASVLEFTVKSGGATVKTDAFDCNSVY